MCQVTLCRSGWYMTSELTKKSRGAIRDRVAPRRAFGAQESRVKRQSRKSQESKGKAAGWDCRATLTGVREASFAPQNRIHIRFATWRGYLWTRRLAAGTPPLPACRPRSLEWRMHQGASLHYRRDAASHKGASLNTLFLGLEAYALAG